MGLLADNLLISDALMTATTCVIIVLILRFWEYTASHGVDQKLNRKLVHVSAGLVLMLCWPLFSPGWQGSIFSAITPSVIMIKIFLIGLGLWKDETMVRSMSRYGDHRELLKGPLYYALVISLVCAFFWRTSPISIAAVCNLCAGDGVADIVGRRFGRHKLFYNKNKSIQGTIAMTLAGFLASLLFMLYFASFGYIKKSWEMALGFLFVTSVSALVESSPLGGAVDDNLTVPLTCIFVATVVL